MATKRAKVNKTLEKAKKLVSKKGKNKTKKGTWPEGQARPQSKAYDIENDKTVPAKRTGYRFTKEGAKKLGKQPNDKPTAEEIEKYRNQTFKVKGKVNKSGPKGVGDGSFRYLYIESRADKSDLNKARKLELGGETPDEVLRLYVYVDVYENDYKLGEGDVVQSYMVDSLPNPTVKAKYLVRYLENHLYLSDNPNDYSINDDGVIYTDQLQDSDGSPASKGQIEKWKEGKEKLYNARYTIIVEAIKERNPSVEELSKATGIGMYAKGGEMTDGAEFFYISGYWKNDKSEFKDYLVTSADDFVDDDGDDYDIFYYGMTEKDIKDAIKDGEKTDLEFVITSYSKANYSKGGVVFDPKEVRQFEKYVFSWYGKNGVAVDDMEEDIPATTAEVLKAVSQYLAFCNKTKKWGGGDSFDREVVHDIIAYNRNPKTTALFYEDLIKDMKKTPILEYGGILQPMIGGVDADPRFDIYNTTMFAEKGAEVPDGDEYAKGGMTSIYEIGVRKKGKPGMFVVSVRAKDEEAALKEFHRQNSLLPGAENFKVVGVYKTARRRLEDGGEMAKGGEITMTTLKKREIKKINQLIEEYAHKGESIEFYQPFSINVNDTDYLAWAVMEDGLYVTDNEGYDGGMPLSKLTFFQLQKVTSQIIDNIGEMAKGGKTHEQGYDDREDERLAMRHGKIASKHFVGSHKRREHSRRDDARFETRNK